MPKIFSLLIAFCFLTTIIHAADYYVSLNGNDQNSGTMALPWQSISKVNATPLNPGDRIYFCGGETFLGGLVLQRSGNNQSPIVIGSYGQAIATIDSQSRDAIYGYNVGGFQIENLRLINGGTNGAGIDFLADDASGKKYPGVRITHLEIDGEPGNGISFGSWVVANPGWDFLKINNVKTHDNHKGMDVYGYTMRGVTNYAIGSIDVCDSEFYHNASSGLVLCGAGGGNIENCSFHDNQSPGGCWTWGVSGITIQHCISYNNLKGDSPDGFGFYLDGGSKNCTIQYCLSYNNETPGFVIFDYPQSAVTKNNMIRYCISENDVRIDEEWGSFEIFPWGDTPIKNCNIYNCVAYLTSRSGKTSASGFEGYGRESHSGDGSGKTTGCSFQNNVIYLDGAGSDMRLFTGNQGATHADQVILQNNLYYSSQNVSAIYFNDRLYSSFNDWRQQHPNQETLKGSSIGIVADPCFSMVGTASEIKDPALLHSLTAYRLNENSPCLNAGLDLGKLFGINPGLVDIFGTELPMNGGFSIGACQ